MGSEPIAGMPLRQYAVAFVVWGALPVRSWSRLVEDVPLRLYGWVRGSTGRWRCWPHQPHQPRHLLILQHKIPIIACKRSFLPAGMKFPHRTRRLACIEPFHAQLTTVEHSYLPSPRYTRDSLSFARTWWPRSCGNRTMYRAIATFKLVPFQTA